MGRVMGVGEQLAAASLQTLRIFMVLTLIFPWLDFCNGILMLKRQTKVMLWSQSLNVALTLITLVLCVYFAPHWNGAIGSLAQSVGAAGEFGVVLYVLKTIGKSARLFPAIGTGSRSGAEA
jgi:O-antigen/teichoic acid export membrane protein